MLVPALVVPGPSSGATGHFQNVLTPRMGNAPGMGPFLPSLVAPGAWGACTSYIWS